MSLLNASGRLVGAALALVGGLALGPLTASAGETAMARLTALDGKDVGTVELEETLAGLLVTARLKGLPPGVHGFHIHDTGSCEPPFASAGGILNPLGAKHGLKNEEGPAMGNMPNLHVPDSGELTVELLNPFVTLAPDADGSLLRESGTAFIIRANADDHRSQPDGNSGARIACGVVKAAK